MEAQLALCPGTPTSPAGGAGLPPSPLWREGAWLGNPWQGRSAEASRTHPQHPQGCYKSKAESLISSNQEETFKRTMILQRIFHAFPPVTSPGHRVKPRGPMAGGWSQSWEIHRLLQLDHWMPPLSMARYEPRARGLEWVSCHASCQPQLWAGTAAPRVTGSRR